MIQMWNSIEPMTNVRTYKHLICVYWYLPTRLTLLEQSAVAIADCIQPQPQRNKWKWQVYGSASSWRRKSHRFPSENRKLPKQVLMKFYQKTNVLRAVALIIWHSHCFRFLYPFLMHKNKPILCCSASPHLSEGPRPLYLNYFLLNS